MTTAHPTRPESEQLSHNPYVGPRAIRPNETLYGRDREKHELADLLIAQRIILLHAPSGAGKTSLIQAGLFPLLRDDDFAPTPALRVNTRAPNHKKIRNPYVYSVAYYLLGQERSTRELAAMSFEDVMGAAAERTPGATPVLVLDQFEEIVLLDPTATGHDHQAEFFRQLGQGLANTGIWALFSMREDFMGGLEPFVRYVPGHLAARYRLDFLNHPAAKLSIQKPAEEHGVTFADAAAEKLVEKLAVTKVQRPGQIEAELPTRYVHPFQLQVVCRQLWRSVRKDRESRGGFRTIEVRDVKKHADIDGALQTYYGGVVQAVAKRTGADEGAIRRWFETELITPQKFRSQTLTGPVSGEADPAEILHELQRLYLVRSDRRTESTWYELSHDQLIGAVLAENENWRRPHLAPWQRAARDWDNTQDPARLLGPWDLQAARRLNPDELTHVERRFLDASLHAEHSGIVGRMRSLLGMLWGLAAVEALVIVLLVVLLIVLT